MHQRILINGLVVDFERNVIEDSSGDTRLEPKLARLLQAFISNSGTVLSRQTIIDEVWSGAYGAEHSLTTAVSQLRKHLKGAGVDDHIIETVPKVGYRFVGIVENLPPTPLSVSTETETPSSTVARQMAKGPIGQKSPSFLRRRRVLIGLAGLVAVALFLVVRSDLSDSAATALHDAPGQAGSTATDLPRGGSIIVVADVNIANAIDGDSIAPVTVGNSLFFENILRGGRRVVIQDTANEGSVFIIAGATSIQEFYEGLPGTQSVLLPSFETVTANHLADADLFVSYLPSDDFSDDEMAAMSALIDAGGTVLFLGDSFDYAANNKRINKALTALQSGLLVQDFKFDQDFRYAAGDQIADHPLTEGITRFTYATVNTVLGGEPLLRTIDGLPFAVVEMQPTGN